jgi:hypothetical protein
MPYTDALFLLHRVSFSSLHVMIFKFVLKLLILQAKIQNSVVAVVTTSTGDKLKRTEDKLVVFRFYLLLRHMRHS